MKKYLLSILFAMFGIITYAQNEPAITLTAKVEGKPLTLNFAVSEAGHKFKVDWGDGNLVETEEIAVDDGWTTTTVTGIPLGEGKISVYGEKLVVLDCSYAANDGTKLTALDVTKATDLTKLTCNTHEITTLDVSKNVNLTELVCSNNPITSLDLSANTQLTSLDGTNMSLTEIDVTKNTALTYVNLNNNQLTSLDVTASEALGTLFCMGNQLTELKADNVTKSVNCSKNNFTLATLPALPCKTYTYAPQNAMQIAAEVKAGETVDLSAQNHITGLAESPQTTTYTWMTEEGTALVAGTDYTEEEGVFTFLVKQDVPVYCEMTTAAFPKFSGSNTFKTTTTLVEGGSSIEGTRHNAPVITATRGNVLITGLANGCDVKVYNLSGQAIAVQTSTGNAVNFSLEPGLYIVKANHISCKVNAQ